MLAFFALLNEFLIKDIARYTRPSHAFVFEHVTHQISIDSFYKLSISNRQIILKQIDLFWKLHLQKSDSLKETIGWRTYGQLDPLIEYKNEASNLYLETISEIKYNSVYNFLKIQIQI